MSRTAHLARLERARLLTLEQRGKARAEAAAVATGIAETVALSEARGAGIAAPPVGARSKPFRRQPGLDWLAAKGRLDARQVRAGERYGLCYRRALGPTGIGSSLDFKAGDVPQGAPLAAVLAQAEARSRAAIALDNYRRLLGRQPALLAACDLICGQELTPREATGSEREAGRMEAVLGVALDLLALGDRGRGCDVRSQDEGLDIV